MNIHDIYSVDIPYEVKCEIVYDVCCTIAKYKGMTIEEARRYYIDKINVDLQRLDNNPIGLYLLHEYIFSQYPDEKI